MKELCPHCGASMMANKYTMNRTLLRALYKIFRTPGVQAKNMNFTKSEYSVYTKLKHWEFISQIDDGLWHITNEGKRFLQGQIQADKEITYFRDRVIRREGKIYVTQILRTEESKQKYREMMEHYSGI